MYNTVRGGKLNSCSYLISGSMTAGEVLEAFCMHDLAGHKWHVQACSAVTGKGIYEGIEEFVELMKFFRSCHKRE